MFPHPDILLEIARQRHQDLLADAERRRIANAVASRPGSAWLPRPMRDGGRVTTSRSVHPRAAQNRQTDPYGG